MDPEPPSSRDEFQIGIVCALPLEFDAVVASLDHVWPEDVCAALGKAPGDGNTYTLGRMKQHNVVLTLLRQRGGKASMGKASAAIVASDLRHSWFSLTLALLVGICGGVPKAGNREMLLGDVVISSSVVQYDFGQQFPDGFRRKHGPQNSLAAPMAENASILGILNTDYGRETVRARTASSLMALQQTRPKYTFPGAAFDKRCSDDFLVKRSRLEERLEATTDDDAVFQPAIFVGGVATGDTVMKSGVTRDAVAKAEGIIAFEMEAAGIWEQLPTLVLKGVCDYADSHKNKKWQDYAAGTAAAAAKAVAAFHTPVDVPRLREMRAAQRESILPFPPDPEFISRPLISDWIKERAKVEGGRAALVGVGGIGKSQLAIRYAHGVRNRSHVFWINATTRATLEESVRILAEGLNLEKPGDSLDDLFRRVGVWFSLEKNGPWTVVLDNFDDSSVLTDDDPKLRKLLSISSNGFTLITSRDVKAAERLTEGVKNSIYLVPDLGEEAAVEMFQVKLEERCEREEAEEVVRLLEFMPLAISQAAAYINSRAGRVSVRDYADMFRAGNEKRGVLLEWEYDELRRYQTSSNSVFGTWSITLEQMQQERPSAVDLLSLMSFFSPQSIPEWALKPLYMKDIERYLPDFTFRDVLPSSVSSLLSRVKVGRRLLQQRSIEGGVQDGIWELWATPEKDAREEKNKDGSKQETKKAKAGKPKKSLKSNMTKLTGKSIRMWPGMMKEQIKEGLNREALSEAKDALIHEFLPVFGKPKDDEDTDVEPHDEAAEELEQDLDVLRKYSMVTPTAKDGVLKMHPLVRYCTHNWLSRSGTLDAWKRRFLKIMVVCLVHPPTGHELHMGDLDGHIEFLTNEEPDDVPSTRLWVSVCSHLISTWQTRGSKDTAVVLALQEKIVNVADKILGPGDRVTIRSRSWLASYALKQGDLEKAEVMFREVIEQAQNVHGRVNPLVVECQFQYVRILRALGRVSEATLITETLYDKLAHAFWSDYAQWTSGAQSIAAHAESMAAEGRFDDAVRLAIETLSHRELSGYQFGDTIACLARITEALSQHSPPEEVTPSLRDIVDHAERVEDTWEHIPFTVCGPFHRHLAVCLERQGDVAGAILVMRKGISTMAHAFPGPVEPTRAVAFGLLDAPPDEEEKRQRLLRELIQRLDSDDGRFNEEFLQRLANIGRLLYSFDRFDECWTLLDALCDHLLAEWGETHLLTKDMLKFRDEMKKWHVEAGRMAREIGKDGDADSTEKETPAAVAAQRVDSAVAMESEGECSSIAKVAEHKEIESVVVRVTEKVIGC
ncbi:hypothetical protein NEMBOFW57_007887 [Staphylotrichum longicolle]|uniref:Nucleoside phosphorylase domain-containing protein n=1 Tax=Staphylotrichum longicolle TaxID=669026 RepID=A0AAD4EV99_9PEZI|nr:hypothetical protein NEMBOFW57_007887 [Staphylotrichum longicolle]